jgi:hypothetical protein
MHAEFKSENLKESDYLEDLGMDEKSILKWTLNEEVIRMDCWIPLIEDRVQ